MKNLHLSSVLLPLLVALVSQRAVAGPIVVSDGPAPKNATQTTPKTIVETDGPPEWTNAVNAGQPLVGSWVIETDGPGSGRLVGPNTKQRKPKVVMIDGPVRIYPTKHAPKKAIAKHKAQLPEAETSTLAPAIPAANPPTPTSSGAPRTAIAFLGGAVFSFLIGAFVWMWRKRAF